MELKFAIQCFDAQEHKLSARQKEAWDTIKYFLEKANSGKVCTCIPIPRSLTLVESLEVDKNCPQHGRKI